MDWGTLLLVALVLVCPLTMFWMMRHGHQGRGPDKPASAEKKSDEHQR
jgi:hypothetical protein